MLASDLNRLISSAVARAGELPEGGRGAAGAPAHIFAGPLAGSDLPPLALLALFARAYGKGGVAVENLRRLASLCSRFIELYGDGPVGVIRAPARINVLGEHVDYVSYLPTASLPFGSREHDMIMLYRAAGSARVRGASTHEDYRPFGFALDEGPAPSAPEDPAGEWLSYLFSAPQPAPHWEKYVRGAVFFARLKYGERARLGYDFLVDSTLPPSGGASSSSALVVLAGAAVRAVNGLGTEPYELALDSAKAEWYVGTRGGSMDHLTICLAERGHAVHIAYRELRTRPLPLPGGDLRWITFFTSPADKGREVMLAYNERAAVSRLLIPAIIEGWRLSHPERHAALTRAAESLSAAPAAALNEVASHLRELPEAVMLSRVERDYADAYRECALSFPLLVRERRNHPLRVRSYALHHLGEVRRVAAAESLLSDPARGGGTDQESADGMAGLLGELLSESHESLRDLYGVSTAEVEEVIDLVRADPEVYGARLMGGGFGGNVLALTTRENVPALTRRVQAGYYAPRGRDGSREGSVMISTPGEGLSRLDFEAAARAAVEQFSALGAEAAGYRPQVAKLLDRVTLNAGAGEVWPVIVAAGRGSRARESGLRVPKPVAEVDGVPAILRVVHSIRAAADTRPPLVIVSPETEPDVRRALSGEDVSFVVQPEPLGTGDAVLCASERMKDFAGRSLVVWGTQPLIRPSTIRRALNLARLFDEYALVLPTALRERPYAPLERDPRGRVRAARETHLEGAPPPQFGETNSGLFVLWSGAMFAALSELRSRHWREAERRYERAGGELGFPNELINHFAGSEPGVFACPFADWREGQGIKTLDDIALCERYAAELEREEPRV